MFLLFCFLTKTFILRFHQKIDPNPSTEQLACVSTLNGHLSFVFRHLKLNLSSFSPPIHLPLLSSILLSPSVPWSSQGTCHVISIIFVSFLSLLVLVTKFCLFRFLCISHLFCFPSYGLSSPFLVP